MSRYANTKVNKLINNTNSNSNKSSVSKYATTIYKKVSENNTDIFIITQEGDRLDNLAFQFYGDTNLWWYIANVNNLNHMNVPADTSLRIPVSTKDAFGS